MSYEQNGKPWSGMYMQQTTYKHDYNPAGGISPRNRQTNYPYGADAPKADIPGPYNNFRPRYGDPLPQHIRDQLRNYLDGQRFDDQPLTDRQRIKRGEEWIGGRRYDEPMTDRGVYGPPRRQYYERERGRDLSPYRGDDRIYNVLDDGRRTSLDRPINRNRDNEFERQNLRLGRHTSLDRFEIPARENYQDRGRNGSPERYYDRGRDNGRGRDFDRRRDESPGKYSRLFRDKFKYLDLYERPAQPMIDSYADHRKMTDRTTYKDYGEFLQEKIKLDELKKQPVEYPAANLRDHLTHRETYREQMHGPEMVRKPYNSQDKLLERERQLEAQIRREMEKIELHDGNFKPWARDAKNPTHHVPKSTNSGVYLFIRTNKLAKADVVKALQEGRSVLANSYGQLKGIATNREIQLLEGQEGWNIRANMTRTGDYWLERSQDSTVIDDMILVIWFPTFNDAEKWVISERKFKTPSFPEPYGSDVMILPLNDSQPQERIAYTYITTEYPRQLDPVMFRENFVPKIKEVLYKHGNDGFFIQSVGAKVIRGHWVKPSSLITTIRFNTRQDALNFFLDPEYKQIRQEISRRIEQLPVYMNWFKPVSFMFTLDKYV
ncbi:zinc finger CCCH domain-containing protein 13 isoform X22 [Magallana gigas]|uniref:zinc finger CCCH domain-containing protein 13 isoform X22 n=1 Tax=Magallana gigas TaxID=29159 RepID=UPI003340455B